MKPDLNDLYDSSLFGELFKKSRQKEIVYVTILALLQELVTLTAHGNLMGRCPSRPFLECLNNRSVKDLVDSGTIEKVGERNVNISAKLGEVAHGHFSLRYSATSKLL